MSKYVKNLVQKELEKRFEGVSDFVVVNTVGIDGITNNELRGTLKEKGINMSVVKNSLMIKAFANMGIENAEELFQGACTLVSGGDSIVDVAKELVDQGKKIKLLTFKGAYVEGECIDENGVVALSKMPSRVELQATIVKIAQTPGSNVAGAIAGPAGTIAGCIKSIIDKAEEAA